MKWLWRAALFGSLMTAWNLHADELTIPNPSRSAYLPRGVTIIVTASRLQLILKAAREQMSSHRIIRQLERELGRLYKGRVPTLPDILKLGRNLPDSSLPTFLQIVSDAMGQIDVVATFSVTPNGKTRWSSRVFMDGGLFDVVPLTRARARALIPNFLAKLRLALPSRPSRASFSDSIRNCASSLDRLGLVELKPQ